MSGYGPNAEAVETFLERIRGLEDGDALRLAAAWQAGDEPRRRLAWRRLRRAAREGRREGGLRAAQSAIADWANASSPLVYTGFAPALESRAQVMRGAIPPLIDAVSALVMGGLIDGEDFETLYGPFRAMDEAEASR